MLEFASATVTVTGKVFVEKEQLMEAMSEKYPEKCKWNEEDCSWDNECSIEEQREVFEDLARNSVSECHPTHDPMKVGDIEIDMSTYRPIY